RSAGAQARSRPAAGSRRHRGSHRAPLERRMTDRSEIDAAFAAHKLEQARRALSMSMAERLAWLDDALDEFGELHGIALWAARKTPTEAAAVEVVPGRHRHRYPDYLALEESAAIKLEYLAGDIFARPGG